MVRLRNRVMDARSRRMTGVTQFDIFQICYFLSCFFFFYLLFFINEDRNTVSSPPLQTVLIEEVAYVNPYPATPNSLFHAHQPAAILDFSKNFKNL